MKQNNIHAHTLTDTKVERAEKNTLWIWCHMQILLFYGLFFEQYEFLMFANGNCRVYQWRKHKTKIVRRFFTLRSLNSYQFWFIFFCVWYKHEKNKLLAGIHEKKLKNFVQYTLFFARFSSLGHGEKDCIFLIRK